MKRVGSAKQNVSSSSSSSKKRHIESGEDVVEMERLSRGLGQLSEMMGAPGATQEATCLLEGLALQQMLFSPLTLLLGPLDPFL